MHPATLGQGESTWKQSYDRQEPHHLSMYRTCTQQACYKGVNLEANSWQARTTRWLSKMYIADKHTPTKPPVIYNA